MDDNIQMGQNAHDMKEEKIYPEAAVSSGDLPDMQ